MRISPGFGSGGISRDGRRPRSVGGPAYLAGTRRSRAKGDAGLTDLLPGTAYFRRDSGSRLRTRRGRISRVEASRQSRVDFRPLWTAVPTANRREAIGAGRAPEQDPYADGMPLAVNRMAPWVPGRMTPMAVWRCERSAGQRNAHTSVGLWRKGLGETEKLYHGGRHDAGRLL